MPVKIFRVPVLLFLTGLAAIRVLYADEVILKNGSRLEGVVTIEMESKIVLKQDGNALRIIPRDQIDSWHKCPWPVRTAGDDIAPEPATPAAAATKPSVEFWPPRRGERYPNLTLYDHRGQLVSLDSLRGKVILLEPVGMTCEACQSLSGAGKVGCFGKQPAQPGVEALEDYFPRYSGGLSLSDPRIAYVQVLLYDLDLHAPSPAEVKAWAHHFKFDERPNVYVLAGTPDLIGPASFAMIPGFQLIDKNFMLRAWWYGETNTGDDLWTKLLPMVPQLLDEASH
jgi:hypothetical protein